MKLWKGAKKGYTRPLTTPEAIEASASAPTSTKSTKSTKTTKTTKPPAKSTKKPPLPPQMPLRTGLMSPVAMDKYMDAFVKNRQRNDFRVAQNAQDKLFRNFAHAHIRAQTVADPDFHMRYFPAFAELPIPIGPHT